MSDTYFCEYCLEDHPVGQVCEGELAPPVVPPDPPEKEHGYMTNPGCVVYDRDEDESWLFK